MAITPPIMVYPLGTDYYDVEVFNTNWKNSLTYLDNNFLNDERVLSEQLSTSTTDVLSAEASNKLFENGVGADVLGYIEDGATHTAGTVWLSKFNKGEFKCLTTNTDDFIDITPGAEKWEQIDDLANADKLDVLYKYEEFNITVNDVETNVLNANFTINAKKIGKIVTMNMLVKPKSVGTNTAVIFRIINGITLPNNFVPKQEVYSLSRHTSQAKTYAITINSNKITYEFKNNHEIIPDYYVCSVSYLSN